MDPEFYFDLPSLRGKPSGAGSISKIPDSADTRHAVAEYPLAQAFFGHLIMNAMLPHDAKARKKLPVYSGVVKYFPDALIGVSDVSFKGNEQHNPGQALHWDRTKSQDHGDCLMRHLIEADSDTEEGLEAAKQMAWRALAYLQIKIERMRDAAKKA